MVKQEELRQETLAQLGQRLQCMPLLPAVVARITNLPTDPTTLTREVERLARRDPPLAIRLLRMANVPRGAGAPPSIHTIPVAIARVGARRLAQTLTQLAVAQVFVPTTLGQKRLWLHAVQVGLLAKRIAELRPSSHAPPESAYLAGLLHDIGRFLMFQHSPQELGAVEETGWSSPLELIAAERRICGFNHAALGGAACQRWSLPEQIGGAVRLHHNPSFKAGTDPAVIRLVRCVQLADAVSCGLLTTPDALERGSDERVLLLEAWSKDLNIGVLGLKPVEFAGELDKLEFEAQCSMRELGLLIRPTRKKGAA